MIGGTGRPRKPAAARMICAALSVAAVSAAGAQGRDFVPRFRSQGSVFEPIRLALVLPTMADGLRGQVARSFHDGCLHGVRADGRHADVTLHAHDGRESSVRDSYNAAAAGDPRAIVGPMLKTSVRALLARYPFAPVPTLLLQPGHGPGYFVMTLDSGQEASDLADFLWRRSGEEGEPLRAMVVEQLGPRGREMRKMFERRWIRLGGESPEWMIVLDKSRDWRRLFETLKAYETPPEDEEDGEEKSALEETEQAPEEPAFDENKPDIVFAAGDKEFSEQVRSFVPQQYRVYAASTQNFGAPEGEAKLLGGMVFMEMPWFLGDNFSPDLDSADARTLPVVWQRFFVLGMDACRAALDSPVWGDGWTIRGPGGTWQLNNGAFERSGELAAYQSGRLVKMVPPVREVPVDDISDE